MAPYARPTPRRSAVAFTNLLPPPAYVSAVAALRVLCLSVAVYDRPARRPGSRFNASSGSALVKPLSERLVPVDADKTAHVRRACALPFPRPSLASSADRDLQAAVQTCVSRRHRLGAWRAERARAVSDIAASVAPYGSWLASLATGTVFELVSGMNLAFLAAFIDAVEWPDVDLVERFVRGFPIVGSIPDSHLFRPSYQPAEVPVSSFTSASNQRWTTSVAALVIREARAAIADGSTWLLERLWAVTLNERRSGHVKGPFSRRQLDGIFGVGGWRCLRRFGVVQGVDASGLPKVRAIDNARTALLNAASTLFETITCISFEFAAIVAILVAAECARLSIPLLALTIGLDDMRAAYRRIPTSQPWYTCFAVWHAIKRRVVYFYLNGHSFGAVSSVVNFNRFPKVMVAMARALFAVMCDQYFDDYMICDLECGGFSAQVSLALCHELVGQELEPKKRKPMALSNVGLGVTIDFSRLLSEHAVLISSVWGRCERVLVMFDLAVQDDYMSPATASSLRGKLGFVLTSAYGRVGRAATQPLTQREFYDTEWHVVGTPIVDAYDFFLALLPALPALRIPVDPDRRPPVVLYTDATFRRQADSVPSSRLGAVVFDSLAASPILHSDYALPPWVFDALAWADVTLIMQCEMIAVLSAVFSAPESFRGRKVIAFVDNTGALSALLHGYASKPDAARITNIFHLLVAALGCDLYFEWVPSAANISDLPSRLAYAEYFDVVRPLGPSRRFSLTVPAALAATAPLAESFAFFRSL